jgi:hypothetical protein
MALESWRLVTPGCSREDQPKQAEVPERRPFSGARTACLSFRMPHSVVIYAGLVATSRRGHAFCF